MTPIAGILRRKPPPAPSRAGRLGSTTSPIGKIERTPGPYPPPRAGAIAPDAKDRRSRRPCHPRAISSGHERYVAVNHGHFDRTGGLGALSLTWGGGGGRNCMACKGSGVQIPSAP